MVYEEDGVGKEEMGRVVGGPVFVEINEAV